jgi:hypothetical protein
MVLDTAFSIEGHRNAVSIKIMGNSQNQDDRTDIGAVRVS